MPDIFAERLAYKPFEYPDVVPYQEAINHSYWLVSEWNFLSDIHDWSVKLDATQKNAIRNTLLAISQIEVSVKKFWGRLGDRLPKPEFEKIGATFAESEVRHADAYSHLLQVLGLNDDFEKLEAVPAIRGRVEYLRRFLKQPPSPQGFAHAVALFSIFVENVSLFSQFAIIKSFHKHLNVLKDIDNVVQATQREETVHAMLGVALVGHIKAEHPDWFGASFYDELGDAAGRAYDAEVGILDWIFEAGELDFLPKAVLKEFLKERFNLGLTMLGGQAVFKVNKKVLAPLRWFEEELHADVSTDFFHKKPVTYAKRTQAITAGDLF